jgi:Ca2+-binding RTX toxin-like protein
VFKKSVAVGLALAAGAATLTVSTGAGTADAVAGYGPPYSYTTVLNGQYKFVALVGQAMIDKTAHGYVYKAGKQSSDLVVTQVPGGVRFADTGTTTFKSLASSCHRQSVSVGVAAVCDVPNSVSSSSPMLIEIWPRLGNDHVDTTALSTSFDVTVLADDGNDVVRTGPGDDFINGAQADDKVWSGGGRDWVRTGIGNDQINGEGGNDYLVGQDGRDVIHGGDGDDRLYGSTGSDTLYGEGGRDSANCGGASDKAYLDAGESARECESVSRG